MTSVCTISLCFKSLTPFPPPVPPPVFKELLSRIVHEKQNGAPHIPKIHEKKGNRFSISNLPGDMEFPSDHKSTRKMKANTVSGGRNKIRKMLEKTRFSILPPKPFR